GRGRPTPLHLGAPSQARTHPPATTRRTLPQPPRRDHRRLRLPSLPSGGELAKARPDRPRRHREQAVSPLTLTPAQERELVAWYRDGTRPRPMTLLKYRRMGLLKANDELNDEGVSLALALGHAQDL